MRILYIHVHEPLQFDEVSLITELGAEVFVANKIGSRVPDNKLRANVGTRVVWKDENIREYDTVIVMHDWACFQRVYAARAPGQRIIWRTIGQSSPRHERNMKALCPDAEIIRYSPRERLGENYAGESALIRFYKDEEQFSGWRGGGGVTMLSSKFGQRNLPDHVFLEEFLSPFDWSLYGNNPEHPRSKGFLSYEGMIPAMQESGVFVSSHSVPASYTLNLIEAMMVGCPIASVGRQIIARNADHVPDAPGYALNMFEVDDILEHGRCGILIDDLEEGRRQVKQLLESRNMAEEFSQRARQRAIDLFGKAKIKEQWREFLGL